MSPYVVGQADAAAIQLPPLSYEEVKPFLEKQGLDKPTAVIVEVPHRGWLYVLLCMCHCS